MQLHHLLEDYLCIICCVIGLLSRYEICHLRKSVKHNKHCIRSPLCSQLLNSPRMKSIEMSTLGIFSIGKWQQCMQSCIWTNSLHHLAYFASHHKCILPSCLTSNLSLPTLYILSNPKCPNMPLCNSLIKFLRIELFGIITTLI
jgi:hypothetical protein